VSDTLVTNYVDRLGKKIAKSSKRPNLPYQFRVVDSHVINAFTVGGGRVYVNLGLIEQADSESELAGVLAHEIGHNVFQPIFKLWILKALSIRRHCAIFVPFQKQNTIKK